MRLLLSACILLLAPTVQAQVLQCPAGHQPYGARCVTQPMADYISCIEASGGNRQELNNEIASAAEKKSSTGAKLDVNAKVAKGGGSIVLGSNAETRIVQKLESKWFPSGMSECARVLEGQRRASTQKQASDHPPKPKLPIRVTVKAERFEFFPGFVVTPGYFSGPKGEDVELDSPSFGKLHLTPGDDPTVISVSGKHYTLRAESISSAGVTLILDAPRH